MSWVCLSSCERTPIFKDRLQLGVMTVNRCPSDYPKSEEKTICDETQYRDEYRVPLQHWPVTDKATNIRLVGCLRVTSQSKVPVAGSPIPKARSGIGPGFTSYAIRWTMSEQKAFIYSPELPFIISLSTGKTNSDKTMLNFYPSQQPGLKTRSLKLSYLTLHFFFHW